MSFLMKVGLVVGGAVAVGALATAGGIAATRGSKSQTPDEWADMILRRHDHDTDGFVDLSTTWERFGYTERNPFAQLLGRVSNEELPALVGVQQLVKKSKVQHKDLARYAQTKLDANHDGMIAPAERLAIVPRNFPVVEENTWGSFGPVDRGKIEFKYGDRVDAWVDGIKKKRFS